ncbi:MAG: sulfatase [Limisphaerales bacterium]
MKNAFLFIFLACALQASPSDQERKNVLVIIADDLNDWIGCLGGHPQVRTPNIDRLAKRGLLFANAHVQATYCGPSRVSFLSGRMPQTTGSRDMTPYSDFQSLQNHPPFPHHFRRNGFTTFGGGKIFHQGTGKGADAECWDTVLSSGQNPGPKKMIHWKKKVWDWGPWPEQDDQMGDFKLAQETAKMLRQKHDQPFLAVAGFRRPHVPLHVPQKWFDLYQVENIILPNVPDDDLDDVPHPAMGLNSYAAPEHSVLVEQKLWSSLVQAYLASISFVDHCVGEILDGLDNGPNRDSTIIVFFSDHGFHLGEKQHWAKRTLWEETTRIPMIIAGPGIRSGRRSNQPVGAIDIYPTLCDLLGVKAPNGLDGNSLQPLLETGRPEWNHAAFTTFEPGDITVRTEHWRYIRHPDGKEELYDHRSDPNEWTNLAGRKQQAAKQVELAKLAKRWDRSSPTRQSK